MTLLCLVSFLFSYIPTRTLAAPAISITSQLSAGKNNLTILRTEIAPAWASAASYRGTADILWSCLLTLTACVYSAIHLNVPRSHETTLQMLWRKMMWVVIALFAPEIVVYTAYAQFSKAKKLVKFLNELRFGDKRACGVGEKVVDQTKNKNAAPMVIVETGSSFGEKNLEGNNRDVQIVEREPVRTDSDDIQVNEVITGTNFLQPNKDQIDPPEIKEFRLAYGFYVVMGGFIIDSREIMRSKRTLSLDGVAHLARQGYFLDISPETISDKTKATITSKALIRVQVTWMVIQCIARKRAGYPLSLLEVHTMVHLLCALVLYGFWFSKPLDVTEPTIIQNPEVIESLMQHLRLRSASQGYGFLLRTLRQEPEFLTSSASNFPLGSIPSEFGLDNKLRAALIFSLPALYGSVHLSAWGFQFPSRIEALLWKISCLDIIGSSIPMCFVLFTGALLMDLGGKWKKIGRYFILSILAALLFPYGLSRLYIVTESFISLRHVPIGVYSTVPWSQNIPHV